MTEDKRDNKEINDNKETNKRPAPKEKLRSIMDAASALTSLGDEESEGSRPGSPKATKEEEPKVSEQDNQETKEAEDSPKRYLPEHKKPDAAPTFPEKMMNLMQFAEKQENTEDYCIAWCEDGRSFIIRNPDEFTRQVVPKFFKATKFSSFTRKLYRWGFRQINRGIGPDDPIIFGSEFFQRDNPELIAKMRSVTAAGTRKQEQHRMTMTGKRTFDDPFGEESHKRMVYGIDQFYNPQKMNMMPQNPAFYGGMNPNGSMPLSNALRPNLMPSGSGAGMGHMGNPNMMSHPPNNNMMMNQMNVPNVPPMNQYMQPNPMPNSQYPSGGPQYPNAQSTAEIVNAAINALRHAS